MRSTLDVGRFPMHVMHGGDLYVPTTTTTFKSWDSVGFHDHSFSFITEDIPHLTL
jgi:hypothetical protein